MDHVLPHVGLQPAHTRRFLMVARRGSQLVRCLAGKSLSRPPVPGAAGRGVNVFGYLKAESGVGEAARLLVQAVRAAGIPVATVCIDSLFHRQEAPVWLSPSAGAPYDTNIICVNADLLPKVVSEIGQRHLAGRRNIAYWAWEADMLPRHLGLSALLVDEIWVHSTFTASAISPAVRRDVFVFPIPIALGRRPPSDRATSGLPSGFLFLSCFDFRSVFDRKNPLAAVEAFTRAFAPGEGPVLVIKTVNGAHDETSLRRLRDAAGARPDITVVDGYLSADEQQRLIGACDAYVSLHRAEGFGLTLAEAMAQGKPVIATGYSGNTDFMDAATGWLVPYRVVPVRDGSGPYPSRAHWAEPDVRAAARFMREVYEQQAEARQRAEVGRQAILGQRTLANAARFISDRLGSGAAAGRTGS